MADTCTHLDSVSELAPSSEGCEDCLRTGGRWVHLRMCTRCGHVGCCDSSPNRHATAHRHDHPDHPLIRSYEPGPPTISRQWPDLRLQVMRRIGLMAVPDSVSAAAWLI